LSLNHIQQTIFPDTLHVQPLIDQYWNNAMYVFMCVVLCLCKHKFGAGDDESKKYIYIATKGHSNI